MSVIKYKNPNYTGSGDEPKYKALSLPVLKKDEIYIGNSQPSGDEILWINTDNSKIKYKNGGVWVDVESGSDLSENLKIADATATYQPKGEYALKSEIPEAYSLPKATSSELGGIKVGYSGSDRKYPVELNTSGQAYVSVPWIDTTATTSSSGLMAAADKTFLDIHKDYQEISSLSNIAAVKSILYLETQTNQSLSISSFPASNVSSISIFIYNSSSSTRTMTIPSSGSYVAMNGNSLSIAPFSWGEISIVNINYKYLIRIGETQQ